MQKLLEEQSRLNLVYKRFIKAQLTPSRKTSRTPDLISTYPALPAALFKEEPVCSFPPQEAAAVFETSGTTTGLTGKHFLKELRHYETALLEGFKQISEPYNHFSHHQWISLIPSFEPKKSSSLSYMIDHLETKLTHTPLQRFCDPDYQLNLSGLEQALKKSSSPIFLTGTSFALADAGEYLTDHGPVQLPEGSVIFDTGGYKGRRKALEKEAFLKLISEAFGIQADRVLNEYGMTELSSQGYAWGNGPHQFPPWLNVVLRNPENGEETSPGERGIITLYDLANVHSCAAIATMDIGMKEPLNGNEAIRILGRVNTAESRGCSLPYENT